jgi:hypothetical protein
MASGARLPLQSTIHRAAVPASSGNSCVLNVRYGRERPPDPPAYTTQKQTLSRDVPLANFGRPFISAVPPMSGT